RKIPLANNHHLKKEKIKDKLAKYVIVSGGLLVIATVILILFLILRVAAPLFVSPSHSVEVVEFNHSSSNSTGNLLGVKISPFIDSTVHLYSNGDLQAYYFSQSDAPPEGKNKKSEVVYSSNIFDLLELDRNKYEILDSAFLNSEFVILMNDNTLVHGK